MVGAYGLGILDAYVNAHLREFDISPDLSLAVKPLNFVNIAGRNYPAVSINLKFR
jgi:hypothetical protein